MRITEDDVGIVFGGVEGHGLRPLAMKRSRNMAALRRSLFDESTALQEENPPPYCR
jgi:hypothetical protein